MAPGSRSTDERTPRPGKASASSAVSRRVCLPTSLVALVATIRAACAPESATTPA